MTILETCGRPTNWNLSVHLRGKRELRAWKGDAGNIRRFDIAHAESD